MADFSGMANAMKKAAKDTVLADKPTGLYFGTVTEVDPIEITIDPKHILTEEFITLGRYITEYSVNLTIESEMWRGLRKNDTLIIAQVQGGDNYVVLDWVYRTEEDDRPAWICEGEVISTSPLEIRVNSYFTIKEEDLILCHSVTDHRMFLSFDNPDIKQKVHFYDRAEAEPLPATVRASQEPHAPRPDDVPPPEIETVTDITFVRKPFEGETEGDLPAYHEITTYNRFEEGDKVMLACERSKQKWFVVDFVHQVNQEKAWWI